MPRFAHKYQAQMAIFVFHCTQGYKVCFKRTCTLCRGFVVFALPSGVVLPSQREGRSVKTQQGIRFLLECVVQQLCSVLPRVYPVD